MTSATNKTDEVPAPGEETDELFATRDGAGPFVFDEAVARVFPDMLRRSIPGYHTLLQLIAVLAQERVEEGSRVYDLGCSLGAVSFAVQRALGTRKAAIIAVDSSPAMVHRMQGMLGELDPHLSSPITPICGNALDVVVEQASLVVLNFTLQFIPREQRDELVARISSGLLPGGILVLSEKTLQPDGELAELSAQLHDGFRQTQGYTQLELSRKRQALENVLVAESEEQHQRRLRAAGLSPHPWFRALHFVSWIAFKK